MRKFSWLLLLIILVVSCYKEKEFDYPLIYIGEVTNIDSTGVVFHANIKDQSKEGIIDYGFVWSCNSSPDINSSQVKITAPKSNGVLSLKITNDLIPDTNYFVRAFARNSKYITYSSAVSFRSKGSLPPIIHSFFPEHGKAGTSITIIGENFSSSISNNIIQLGNAVIKVDSASSNKLVVKISEISNVSGIVNISIQVANHIVKSQRSFRFDGNIIDFTPKVIKPGGLLYIKVENYNPNPLDNIISIGGINAEIINIKYDTLICRVPLKPKIGSNQINVTSNNIISYSAGQLTILSPWLTTKEGNQFIRNGTVAFSINGKGYMVMGEKVNNNDFYEFNPLNNHWRQCTNFPSFRVINAIGFSIGNKGYVGLGSNCNDLWEYNPELNNWQQKKSFPGNSRESAACIVIGDLAYIGLGKDWPSGGLKDLWQYNPNTDEWKRLADCPRTGYSYGFSINNIGYFGFEYALTNHIPYPSNAFWKYDPQIDNWSRLSDFPGEPRFSPVVFSLNGYGYVGMGKNQHIYYKDFWQYDSSGDKWYRITDVDEYMYAFLKSFVINDKAYIFATHFMLDLPESLIVFQP